MMVMVCHHRMLDVEMVDSYEMTGSGYSFEMLDPHWFMVCEYD